MQSSLNSDIALLTDDLKTLSLANKELRTVHNAQFCHVILKNPGYEKKKIELLANLIVPEEGFTEIHEDEPCKGIAHMIAVINLYSIIYESNAQELRLRLDALKNAFQSVNDHPDVKTAISDESHLYREIILDFIIEACSGMPLEEKSKIITNEIRDIEDRIKSSSEEIVRLNQEHKTLQDALLGFLEADGQSLKEEWQSFLIKPLDAKIDFLLDK